MAVNKRDLSTITDETGWPVVNYAQEERNFQTTHNGRSGALSIPRFKFTWLVEFQFSPRALDNPITNLREFVSDTGKLYTHLLTIDHPQPEISTEKLRSYNKWINVPTQVNYPTASMTFHDDSTSVVQALWKEHLNFYTHQATIGDTISGVDVQSNLGSSQEVNSFQFTDALTATDGGEMRSAMGRRPSLGMRLKPNDGRHFLESIVVYDLGTEPDGINVYWFHKPMLTDWKHDNLDKEDRTGNVRVSTSFDYEGYYFTIGQNRGRLSDYIRHILGAFPDGGLDAPRKSGIARDGQEQVVNRRVENTNSVDEPALNQSAARAFPLPDEDLGGVTNIIEPALESELNPIIPNSLAGKERDLEQVRAEKAAILNNANGNPTDDPATNERLAKLNQREGELVDAITQQKAEQRANEFVSAQERSALDNTREANGIGAPPVSTNSVPNPANQEEADGFRTAGERAQQLSNTFAAEAEEQELQAQLAADAGDNALAQQKNADAQASRDKAVQAQRSADFLLAESERINPSNQ